ncbi:sterile alpha motif/pointed domain-containing protein, partial [Dimargaris cristalligena]
MESLTQWDVNKVYSWFCSLGFQAYEKQIRDNQITGEVLLHLHHEALRDLSIDSLGKRLVILKAIYQLKLQHRVPITTEDY